MKFLKLSFALAVGLAFSAAVTTQAQIPITFALSASYSHGNQGSVVTINNSYILSRIFAVLGSKVPAGASLAINTNGNVVVLLNKAIIMDLSYGTNLTTTNVMTQHYPHGVTLSYTNVVYGYAYITPFFFYDPIWTGTETTNSLFSLTGKAIAGGYPYYDDVATPKVSPKGFYYDGGYMEFGTDTETYSPYGVETETADVYEYYDLIDGAKTTIGVSLNSNGLYTLSFVVSAMGDCYNTAVGSGFDSGTISAKGTQQGGESFLDPFNGYGNYFTDYYDYYYY